VKRNLFKAIISGALVFVYQSIYFLLSATHDYTGDSQETGVKKLKEIPRRNGVLRNCCLNSKLNRVDCLILYV